MGGSSWQGWWCRRLTLAHLMPSSAPGVGAVCSCTTTLQAGLLVCDIQGVSQV